MSVRCKLGICNKSVLIHDGLSHTPKGESMFATTKECPRCHEEKSTVWPLERKVKWLKDNGLDYRFVK